MSDTAHGGMTYRGYWIAWGILLVLTVLMVTIANPVVILAGIAVKATIISLWFMHLKFERMRLGIVIAICAVVTTLVLYGLLAWDAAVLYGHH